MEQAARMTDSHHEEPARGRFHFGHQTSPVGTRRMKPYIFGARNGIYIIDLQQR
jgi:ribosomal protein S2